MEEERKEEGTPKKSAYDGRLHFSKYLVDMIVSITHHMRSKDYNAVYDLMLEYYLASFTFMKGTLADEIKTDLDKLDNLLINYNTSKDRYNKIELKSDIYKLIIATRLTLQKATASLLLPTKDDDDEVFDFDKIYQES